MNNPRLPAAALGFAFVAAWIAFNLGYALLCLVGAAVFYAAASVVDGNLDLGELQTHFTKRADPSATSTAGRTPPRVK